MGAIPLSHLHDRPLFLNPRLVSLRSDTTEHAEKTVARVLEGLPTRLQEKAQGRGA